MFRAMRRKKQALDEPSCIEILTRHTSGVLALIGDDNYPYTVPLSHVYHDRHLYFHCALHGHKIDAIKQCDKATFCVIDADEVVPEKFLTRYRSVVAFGRITIMTDKDEKLKALELLARRFSPDYPKESEREIQQEFNRTCMLDFKIEHLTGKVALDLATG